MKRKWIWIAPLAILGIVLFGYLGGEIVMLLWNWLLPPLFGWRTLTFWQGLGCWHSAGFCSGAGAALEAEKGIFVIA